MAEVYAPGLGWRLLTAQNPVESVTLQTLAVMAAEMGQERDREQAFYIAKYLSEGKL